ncbi:Mechanosensitive ion channel protein [Seminavis robusta]|uniref:Mechanosensitive ion channel protein n=1 Tax=Seminavis robusta TaxID=568900 RepID=A0A9N8HE66_9STRA|nr:Mechanosensitive ion channel protein [Seminavis robusta]|eukprot:Sro459_g147240.1 Mechanosensitive ion channel protein (1310) ;mRNA; f:12321-17067
MTDRFLSLDKTSEKKESESSPLAIPTPGQLLHDADENDNLLIVVDTTGSMATNSHPTIPPQIQLQENATETVRHRNHRPDKEPPLRRVWSGSNNTCSSSELMGLSLADNRNNSTTSTLQDLFRAPEPPDASTETGLVDFRAALLAEQQQQDEILREQQRRFEQELHHKESQGGNHAFSGSSVEKTTKSPSNVLPPLSPSRSPSPLPPMHRNTSNTESRHTSTVLDRNNQDSPNDQPNTSPAHRHNRTVSWSVQNLEQVIPVPEIAAPSASAMRRKRLSSLSGSLRNILADVTPFESEAETNILRAVDDMGMQQQREDGEASRQSSFFSNLPLDFTLLLPSASRETHRQDPPRRRSTHHRAKLSELSIGNMSSSPPTEARAQTPKRPNKRTRKTHHRHTQSVEETLFGLTAQLSKLDGDAMKNMKQEDLDEEFLEQRTSKLKKGHERAISSAERFAEAAHFLVNNAMRGSTQHGRHRHQSVSTLPPISDIESPAAQPPENNHPDASNDSASRHEEQGTTHESKASFASAETSHKSKHPYQAMQEDASDEAIITANGQEQHEEKIPKKGSKKHQKHSLHYHKDLLAEGIREDWETFNEFLSPRTKSMWAYCKTVLLFVILPSTGLASIFHYVLANPKSLNYDEATEAEEHEDPTKASVSWWILFIAVRQVITLSLALATHSFCIDYIVLGSRFSLRFLGPVATLLLVQSKGWPFTGIMWALYDMILLAGSSRFVNHWCYWQNVISMFNENNPSGNIPNSSAYLTLLRLSVAVGGLVAVKRLLVGLFLGRQTFIHHGEEVAKIMGSMVLLGEAATLSRLPLPRRSSNVDDATTSTPEWKHNLNLSELLQDEVSSGGASPMPNVAIPNLDDNGNVSRPGNASAEDADGSIPKSVRLSVGGGKSEYTASERQMIIDLLERWEEPELVNRETSTKVTMSAVLQFRRALAHLKRHYPFSPAFGPCATRELCLESAQTVFDRLLLRDIEEDGALNFDVLAVVANVNGEMDEEKLKDLIRLFRPDRDGRLSRFAFVKSVDDVYKKLRLLQANIHNSSQIDNAIEHVINVGFYFVLGCCVLAVFGLDPLQLFFSLSSFVIAFAFVIGAAASKYFEGVLLILVQRPYGVGDRIHVANSQDESSFDGSSGWIVEKINLFSTTVCYGTTNERATVSNGTLASSRIINAARSPNAVLYVNLKFGIDVPYQKIEIFQSAVEVFVKARPREWLGFLGFRASSISVDRGFIEYKVVVQHREAWQSVISILTSKAKLTSYCLEVAKKLQMRYVSPPLPVDLNVFDAKQLPFTNLVESNSRDSIEKTA